jgi:hypothetical protein
MNMMLIQFGIPSKPNCKYGLDSDYDVIYAKLWIYLLISKHVICKPPGLLSYVFEKNKHVKAKHGNIWVSVT